ncbi:MAG: DUF882 domain-containing protein [Bdellovibrionales bacterium]|nr:DUF882 domain-containing protein [Bdellovibrionales bacterium]
MNVKTYFPLLLCASLMVACGKGFQPKFHSNQPLKKSPETPPTEPQNPNPGKEDNIPEDSNDLGSISETLKVCYFSPNDNHENCLSVVEADDDQKQNEYNYKDPQQSINFPTHFDINQYLIPKYYLDLKATPKNTKLTTNFQVEELMQLHKGDLALFSPDALFYIQKMREDLNRAVHIHSAFRGPAYNQSIGGATWSRHMYGDAIDFHVNEVSIKELAEYCTEHGAAFYQIYKTHIHCDWRNTPLNEGFYEGPVKNQKFINLKELAQSQSSIQIQDRKNKWQLSVQTEFVEDEDSDLIYEWEVTYKNKTKIYSSPTIQLNKHKSEHYHIKVTVGGSIELEIKL